MVSKLSKSTWEYIIINYRLPKAITAVLVGMGLSVSGLLMQTLFRNPLAGPYVLDLSSGASLGVAL
jgi:iron complex transport system permease protein